MNDNMGRRRSVDVGGLALALSDEGRGHGWGGWEETDCGETRCVTCSDGRRPPLTCLDAIRYAEVLIDVRLHTETIVSQEGEHVYVFPPRSTVCHADRRR